MAIFLSVMRRVRTGERDYRTFSGENQVSGREFFKNPQQSSEKPAEPL